MAALSLRLADSWYRKQSVGAGVTLVYEHHISPDLRCNIWLIQGRDRDLLVDSGMGVMPLRKEIERLTSHQVLAVASHTHFDHVGNHHEFDHRLCHPAEREVLRAPDAANTVWTEFCAMCDVSQSIDALPFRGFSFDDYLVKPAPPTQLIAEGDELDLGDRLLSVFHMPGHSPGSICLYEAETRTIFCGDVLYDGELLDSLYHSDAELYRETLARLREIPATTFHCGHFASFGRDRAIELIDHYCASRAKARPAGEN